MGGIHLYAAMMTALFEREQSGVGRLVEVAMQETVYSIARVAAWSTSAHREGAASDRQPAGGTGERAVRRVPDQGWLCGDPPGDRRALAQYLEGRWDARS